jgi:hypothetical protein
MNVNPKTGMFENLNMSDALGLKECVDKEKNKDEFVKLALLSVCNFYEDRLEKLMD